MSTLEEKVELMRDLPGEPQTEVRGLSDTWRTHGIAVIRKNVLLLADQPLTD